MDRFNPQNPALRQRFNLLISTSYYIDRFYYSIHQGYISQHTRICEVREVVNQNLLYLEWWRVNKFHHLLYVFLYGKLPFL